MINVLKSENIEIRTETVGSLVTFYFTNVNSSKVASFFWAWDKINDYLQVNESKSNITSDYGYNEWETNSDYYGLYDYHYFLPMNEVNFIWESYSSTSSVLLSKIWTFSTSVGINKTITIDIETGQKSETNSTESAIIASEAQLLRVQSLSTRKINSVH
jgi:hypothetical protein